MTDKKKFELEYLLKTSPSIIEEAVSTPSGLSGWFADDVNIKDGVYTFFWSGESQDARLISRPENKFIRFQWMEDEEDGIKSYFEFRPKLDDMTKEIILTITDFAEEDEIEEASDLWNQQISELRQKLGI